MLTAERNRLRSGYRFDHFKWTEIFSQEVRTFLWGIESTNSTNLLSQSSLIFIYSWVYDWILDWKTISLRRKNSMRDFASNYRNINNKLGQNVDFLQIEGKLYYRTQTSLPGLDINIFAHWPLWQLFCFTLIVAVFMRYTFEYLMSDYCDYFNWRQKP